VLDFGPALEVKYIGAGRQDDGYADSLRSLDWQRLFAEYSLGEYFERLREEWAAAFDYVLIDSRTGYTDAGGICCIQMADVLVTFFTTNRQSVEGVKRVMRDVQRARQLLAFDREFLALVPVLTRDQSEMEYREALRWREICARELGEFYRGWLPQNISPL